MNDPITKGTLLKHYYLLGFTAAETLKKTQAFEVEGFTYQSLVYKTFKKFKDSGLVAGDPPKPKAPPKATPKRKADEEGAEPAPKKPRKPYTRKNKVAPIGDNAEDGSLNSGNTQCKYYSTNSYYVFLAAQTSETVASESANPKAPKPYTKKGKVEPTDAGIQGKH